MYNPNWLNPSPIVKGGLHIRNVLLIQEQMEMDNNKKEKFSARRYRLIHILLELIVKNKCGN